MTAWALILLAAALQAPAPCTVEGLAARCLTLEVPERPGLAGGRSIPIRVVVLPRAGKSAAREPIFVLHGGPGAAATSLTGSIGRMFAELRADERDLVFVDQRGTGGSHRLDCAVAPEAFLVPLDPSRCLARLSAIADLTAYTTDHFVADLDAVRATLGYGRVVLYGGSYGTRAAYVYARTHPSRVAALVLAAPAPVSMSIIDTFAGDARAALDAAVRHCLSDAACAREHPTLQQDLDAVRRTFTSPFEVLGLQFLQYSSAGTRTLIDQMAPAARGNTAALREAIAQARASLVDLIDLGLHLSVMCSEEAPFASPPAPGAALSPAAAEYARACRGWPRAELAPSFRRLTKLPQPALVVAGEWDPVTPPSAGRLLAEQFSPGRLVILSKAGHSMEAASCLASMTRDFLAGRPVEDRCAKR